MAKRSEKTSNIISRAALLPLFALLLTLSQSQQAVAQWSAPDAQGNTSTTSTGNVGVGTAAPASKLDVSGASGATFRTGGASAGFSMFDRPSVPGDQLVFQGNAGNYSVINTATRNANFGSEKLSGLAMWTVDNTYTPNATQFQLQNSPSHGGVIFTQKFGTGAQGDKKVSFQTAWNQLSVPTQFVLDTNGNVGVGTSSPGYHLHVYNSQNTEVFGTVENPNAGATAAASILAKTNNGYAYLKMGSTAYGSWGAVGTTGTGSFYYDVFNGAGDHVWRTTASANERMRITNAGNVGIGTTTPASKLHVVGDITVTGNISGGNINAKYQDVAEWVPSAQALSAGTVVVLDTGRDNHVASSSSSYDTRVAGVISAQPGIALGEKGEGKVLVATTGRVKVRVDATRAPIKVGDLLVTSDVAGVAMRSQPLDLGGVPIHRPGTLIGKALQSLDKGTGEILVLLSLQ